MLFYIAIEVDHVPCDVALKIVAYQYNVLQVRHIPVACDQQLIELPLAMRHVQ
jgi:hypothetical protein